MGLISKGFRKVSGGLVLAAGLVALSGCDNEDYKGFTKVAEGVYISQGHAATDRQLTADTILRTIELSLIDQTVAQGAQFLTMGEAAREFDEKFPFKG